MSQDEQIHEDLKKKYEELLADLNKSQIDEVEKYLESVRRKYNCYRSLWV